MSARVAVLVSGSGTNLQALIDSAGQSDSSVEIAVVVSNNEGAFGLERARNAGIEALHIDHRGKKRTVYDRELIDALEARGVQWVFLAGFMRILTPDFLSSFADRVINIHPALLPSFPGVRGQQQAHEAGVQIAGATVHFVDAGTDTGPIIAQGAVARLPTDTLDDLSARILRAEHQLFPMVMQWAGEGRLSVDGRSARVDLKEGESRFLFGD
jgi:phosphoribosylglycinamide formyltransferase-1